MIKGYSKKRDKYIASIKYKNLIFALGSYKTEEEAVEKYNFAKKIIEIGINVEKQLFSISKTRKPTGLSHCYFDISKNKYIVSIRIGSYDDENSAKVARDSAIKLLGIS